MNRSQKAGRYGRLAEEKARRRYGLRRDRAGTHDAIDDDGRPWDVKAAMLSRSDPRFRLWNDQHEFLEENGGGYVFVAYLPVGRGIQIQAIRSVAASSIRADFYGAGGHRDGAAQLKLPVAAIFDNQG